MFEKKKPKEEDKTPEWQKAKKTAQKHTEGLMGLTEKNKPQPKRPVKK